MYTQTIPTNTNTELKGATELKSVYRFWYFQAILSNTQSSSDWISETMWLSSHGTWYIHIITCIQSVVYVAISMKCCVNITDIFWSIMYIVSTSQVLFYTVAYFILDHLLHTLMWDLLQSSILAVSRF